MQPGFHGAQRIGQRLITFVHDLGMGRVVLQVVVKLAFGKLVPGSYLGK